MSQTPFWWPLELSGREDAAFRTFRQRMRDMPIRLDANAVNLISNQLSHLMTRHLVDIIERDGLPHLAHVINGWGNAQFRNHHLIEELIPFVHRDRMGRPVMLQCDPEGEFHPWQSFAYAVMAGIAPEEPIAPLGVSLRQLAYNSRSINTHEGRELGHLLFALAHLDPDIAGRPFSLKGRSYTIPDLMELAIEAHHYGTFEVCRKFHLTEGLCAMAARVVGFEEYRYDAQGFLDGQLDMLFILGLIIQEASELITAHRPAGPDSLLHELRRTLVIGNYLENHCYYAGHLIELACFAAILGYRIAPEHYHAMVFILNELNAILPGYLPHVSFLDCFLHLGHYRRAMTLLLEVERARAEQRPLTRLDLARFTVDFDAPSLQAQPLPAGIMEPSSIETSVYDLEAPSSNPRPEFEAVVAQYASVAPTDLKPRGRFDHFRRIGPAAWPRAVHYELLDYGGVIGTEIHLESDTVRSLGPHIRAFTSRIGSRFPDHRVEWEPTWYQHRGRLRLLFEGGTPPEVIAAGMCALIAETFVDLDSAARNLSSS